MAKGKYEQWITEEGLIKVEGWARDGLTDEQIAHNMGVAYSTFREWKKKYSALSAVLKKGKEVVDRQVENALLKRALGYRFKEVTEEYGEITKVVTKEVQPDTTAQIIWLKNRKPDVWRDKNAIDYEKAKAEKELTQERTKLIKGIEKDTSLLEELSRVVNDDD